MSFIETRGDVDICNKALSRIGQTGITGTLDAPTAPNSNAVRECRLHYKSSVRSMLEMHHWNLATKRDILVETTNERALEWSFCYVTPEFMAFPVSVHTPGGSTVGPIAYYRGLQGLLGSLYGKPLFTYSGDKIYSMLGPAELEFTSFDITEHDFTQSLEDCLVLWMAAKLAYSLAKDHQMGNAIKQEALSEINRVLTGNLNEQQHRYGTFISEAEMAREGIDPLLGGYGIGFGR